MNKKTIKDVDLKGKRVFIRVDFNVPIKNGKIEDDTRIRGALPTIKYAIEHDAKVILASHLGRPLKDKKKAADLFIRAGRNGAPPWVFSLAGGLYNESNERDAAEAVLAEMIKTEVDPNIIKRLEDKLTHIRETPSK